MLYYYCLITIGNDYKVLLSLCCIVIVSLNEIYGNGNYWFGIINLRRTRLAEDYHVIKLINFQFIYISAVINNLICIIFGVR